MNQLILLYTTVANKIDAEYIAQHLLEQKLIACAQIIECSSIFRWQAKIDKNHEWILITKIKPEDIQLIEKTIISIHPYDIPAIIRIPITTNDSYFAWTLNETKSI